MLGLEGWPAAVPEYEKEKAEVDVAGDCPEAESADVQDVVIDGEEEEHDDDDDDEEEEDDDDIADEEDGGQIGIPAECAAASRMNLR